MKAKRATLNRRLGQLKRRLIWNYELIVALEGEKRKLEKLIAEREAANKRAAWIWQQEV